MLDTNMLNSNFANKQSNLYLIMEAFEKENMVARFYVLGHWLEMYFHD